MDDLIQIADGLRAELERRRGQWRRIADESSVPYKTIKNFMQRSESFPSVPTLNKLLAWLKADQEAA